MQANVGKHQIAYRETITAKATGEGKFIRDAASGGKAMYGHVILEITPGEQGSGLNVKNSITAG